VCMPYVLRKFLCDTCNRYTERKLASKARRRCQECGINAMVESSRTMAAKNGASWDSWSASTGPKGRPRKQRSEE